MSSIINIYQQTFLIFKTKSLLFFQVVAAFLLPIKPLILLVFFMIALDTISGLYKAKKTGDAITSRKLSKAVSKLLLYQVGLITFYIIEKFLLGEFVSIFTPINFFLTKMVAIFFCTIEIVSLNENVKEIYGLNFFELFKKTLTRVKYLKKEIEEIGNK